MSTKQKKKDIDELLSQSVMPSLGGGGMAGLLRQATGLSSGAEDIISDAEEEAGNTEAAPDAIDDLLSKVGAKQASPPKKQEDRPAEEIKAPEVKAEPEPEPEPDTKPDAEPRTSIPQPDDEISEGNYIQMKMDNNEEPEDKYMAVSIESAPDNVVIIKVVGVGGAGCNVVNRMVSAGTQGVEFIAVNTDKPALSASQADQKVQIGEKLTMGQGAGASPEIGKKAAEESRNNVAKALEDADMVFIAGGMGGGTGTGASPIIADIAREARALTVAVVTKPFAFEGKRRMEQAEEGIRNLMGKVDALLVIPNDRLRSVSETKLTFANAFEIADGVLHQAVVSISELIKKTGFINLDFADVTSIMKDAGYAHMGVGHAAGKGKAEEAARAAVSSPLMETSINGARGVLVNITGSVDIDLEDVEIAASLVSEAAHPDANIIFGANFDENMEDEILVVVIATRFDGGMPPRINTDDINKVRASSQINDSYVSKRVDAALSGTEPAAAASAPAAVSEPAPPPQPAEPAEDEDPFATIFQIFNSR